MTNSVQSIDSWQDTYGHPTGQEDSSSHHYTSLHYYVGSELGFFGASTSIGEIVGIFAAIFLVGQWLPVRFLHELTPYQDRLVGKKTYCRNRQFHCYNWCLHRSMGSEVRLARGT